MSRDESEVTAARRRRQLFLLNGDPSLLLNPVVNASAIRSRQLLLLQDNEDEDDVGLAPGVHTPPRPSGRRQLNQAANRQPRPPTPPRRPPTPPRSRAQAEADAEEFLKSMSSPAARPPNPQVQKKGEYRTCFYLKPVIVIAHSHLNPLPSEEMPRGPSKRQEVEPHSNKS